MTIDEMIAVLEAAKRGEKIEYSERNGSSDWVQVGDSPVWDFYSYKFRVAKKKVKLLAWVSVPDEGSHTWMHFTKDNDQKIDSWRRVPQFDCEVEE